jgi:nucleoside-diphosphate-sugar epimerase
MRVFVTGASGYVGNAVAQAFRQAGHKVYGLVRSQQNAIELYKAEIIPVLGDLRQPESYLKAAENAEVLVNCAFDMSKEGISLDELTLDTFIKIAGKVNLPRTIIYTSGVWIYGNTNSNIADEASPLIPLAKVKWRLKHEEKVLQAAKANIRTIVMRPGTIYGGSGGLTSIWFKSVDNGEPQIIGTGENRWAMVHKDDLGRAYVLSA